LIDLNQISTRKEKITDSVFCNEIKNAIKLLLDFVRDYVPRSPYFNEVVILSANFNNLEAEKRQGVIDFKDADLKRNRFLTQILTIPDLIVEELQNAA
jgi:hypothetical protein